ncbi:hypothetical protein [Pantoea sp. A4]|uniref:hypothetical protein n=1 Tax=Pantoea sp. A4 TaxID=1225184 RepID=UPI000372A623|nr:hypothetical protein [Pantoea sp. A4]
MTISVRVIAKSGLVAALLLAGVVQQATAAERFGVVSSGRVAFSGEIYEPACRISVDQATVASNCYQQGQFQQRALKVSTTSALAFNDNRTQAQLAWLDSSQREGILTVSYR